ncbi:MAG: pilus assembly protein [Rhizobiales bacterium]|nr:pilus assembly protein [Hyphomicrobiales bacterium]
MFRALLQRIAMRKDLWSNQSGVTAVEFALVAPIFFMILLGIVCLGYIFGVHHELRQIASEAARASVAGLSNAERQSLASGYVNRAMPNYGLLSSQRMTMTTQVSLAPSPAFHVILNYDLSGTFPYQLGALFPMMPSPMIQKRAVVGLGGY